MTTRKLSIVSKDKYIFQYVFAISASLSMFSGGMAIGWSSPSIPKLLNENSPIPITNNESSLVISIFSLGGFCGPFIAALSMDKIGRKWSLVLGVIPLIIGWTVIAFANSLIHLLIGRILNGLAYYWVITVLPIYTVEIASNNIRGTISTLTQSTHDIGFLLGNLLGSYLDLHLAAGISMIAPICFVAIFAQMPESPYYLLRQNKDEQAISSLKRLRGHANIETDLKEMRELLVETANKTLTFTEIFRSEHRKNLILCLCFGIILHFCGGGVYVVYAETLFIEMNSNFINPKYSSFILALVMLVFGWIGISIIDFFGRRIIFLPCLTIVMICNFSIGLYFYLCRTYDLSYISWLPIVMIMLLIATFSLGVVSVPFVLLGELFPRHLKGVASVMQNVGNVLASVVALQIYHFTDSTFGSDISYWTFSLFCLLFLLYFLICMPETRGKSLGEIQKEQRENKKT